MSESRNTGIDPILDVQKSVIKELLDEKMKNGEIKSTSEYQKEWDALIGKISQGTTFMRPRLQSEITDSKSHNETFEETELDLRAIYKQINQINEDMTKHKRLNQSTLQGLATRIKKVDDELEKIERIGKTGDTGTIEYETFIDSNSIEKDPTYYTERNGKQVPDSYHARWDAQGESIRLPLITREDALTGPGGMKLGQVTIGKQLGRDVSEMRSLNEGIEKAVDSSNTNYWMESILMDAPIEVEMGKEFYGVAYGAMAEIFVSFDYVTTVNELKMKSFGEYPLDVVAIEYFETDDLKEEGKAIVSPEGRNNASKSRSFDGDVVFQFPDIVTKRIRIILNQRHYVRKDIVVSEKERRQLRLFMESRKEEKTEVELKSHDIDQIIEEMTADRKEVVSKYEYQYGLYRLSIGRNEYHNNGIYVSKEIPISRNVKTVRIESKERHPEDVHPLKMTEVEFYIHDGKRWYPIMQSNQDKVYSELLVAEFGQGEYRAKTRFTVERDWVIRKNGVSIDKAVLLEDNKTVLFGEYDASAYYTIEYTPVKESWSVDFLKAYTNEAGEVRPNTIKEERRGTDAKGRIKLKHSPFLDRKKWNAQEKGYDPSFLENEFVPIVVKLIDKNGYHIAQPTTREDRGIQVHNVTDYDDTGYSRLSPYNSEAPVYQYEVHGEEIEFNTVLPETTRILVEYPYLVSGVRVKAILRRNIPGFHGLTPIVEDYVLHMQTLV